MQAKRLFCLALLASLPVACAQPAPTPTPAPVATTSPQRFRAPYGIFVDSSGRIFVADRHNNRIVRIDDMNGTNWTTFP